jgi:hypothetical protein
MSLLTPRVDDEAGASSVGVVATGKPAKRSARKGGARESPSGGRPMRPIIQDQVRRECRAMVRHLLGRGEDVPPWIVSAVASAEVSVSEGTFEELCHIHTHLGNLVAPARPASILLVETETPRGLGRFRGPLGILGQLALLNLVFLLALLGFALSPYVNESPEAGDFFDSQGVPLMANLAFIVAAAGLGVSFGTLFEIQDKVLRRTFDPVCVVIYWTRLPLGIVSGVFLSNLLVGSIGGENGLAKPLLALLGGFSAPLVHRLLTRLLETVAKFVGSSTTDPEERKGSGGMAPGAGSTPAAGPREEPKDPAQGGQVDADPPRRRTPPEPTANGMTPSGTNSTKTQ